MRICFIAIAALLFSVSVYAADASPQDFPVSEKIPITKDKVSVTTAMFLDILPGGGHFYLGNYGSGTFFGILKTGSAASIWYFYSQWQDSRKKYHSVSADQVVKY